MNIRFNYLYRDAGNYKAYGSVVFHGAGSVLVADAEMELERSLIEGNYFVAADVEVPDLRPAALDCTLDHDWHEVECLEECDDPVDDQLNRTIDQFVKAMKRACSPILRGSM